jgi:hypothetical protein
MSNHPRHRPKHRKPLPCALTAKPAQTPPITVVPPHKANAKPAPRSAITPEIRKKIEESLASKPNVISDPRTTVLVEADTSQGTKTIKVRETDDVDSARDDAAEKIVRKSKPKKIGDKLLTSAPKKQPAYLKSVAQPVVRTTNPDAPFGYDDNDRPIGVPVGKPYVKPELKAVREPRSGSRPCGDCGQDLCKHCHPENVVQAHELLRRPGTTNPMDPEATTTPELTLEENLRRQFGIAPTSSLVLTTSRPTFKFQFYPEILRITRKQLVELFDEVVDTEVETMKLMETQLKNPWFIRHQIGGLRKTIAHAQKRLQCIPLLVQRSERLILSWSAQVMKYGTKTIPARAPEDILDAKTRYKFTYEERKKLKKYQHWKTHLQAIVRETQAQMNPLQQRLDNWGSSPDDFESVTVTQDRKITFGEKFREPEEPINDLSETYAKLRNVGVSSLVSKTDAYIHLLSTDYQMLADSFQKHPLLRPWRWFENEIVLQAIGYGLIRPTRKTFETYPQLKKYLNQDAWSEDDVDEIDDSGLRGSILKTGGSEIGASIYNFGLTRKDQPRMSGSFDNAVDFGNKNRTTGAAPSVDSSGGLAGEIDSGDYAEEIASE